MDDDDEYVPYETPAERSRRHRRLQQGHHGGLHHPLATNEEAVEGNQHSTAAKLAVSSLARKQGVVITQQQEEHDQERGPTLGMSGNQSSAAQLQQEQNTATQQAESLLSISKRLRTMEEADPVAAKIRKQEELEKQLLLDVHKASSSALISAKEFASDIKFTQSVTRKWTPDPSCNKEESDAIIRTFHILVDGVDVPFACPTFQKMNLPAKMLEWILQVKGLVNPTPIQMQGLPVALSGRDMIGVASTGSGKTLTFIIPSVMASLESHSEKPLHEKQGPFVLILGPSRELQRQTYQICNDLFSTIGDRRCSCTLAIGGESKGSQLSDHNRLGTHILIGTPGRVSDYLNSGVFTLERCTMLVLDEGDRMMDEGFDEEVKKIIGHFKGRMRQTILFSATMPRRVVDFARDALVRPVVVNVGRAGAASANVTQFIELVKKESRFRHLLECLQRTGPPVLVFCTKNGDVDDVHEYLLLKGCEARGTHAGKSQDERNTAVDDFKTGRADILVASDVAAKGLDFPSVAHVINFDMPTEIENYVHRIGRTGRGGKSGMATTFVDILSVETSLMLDLAGVLREARQPVPMFLLGGPEGEFEPAIQKSDSASDVCTVCGGFGHRIQTCPKVIAMGKKNKTRDVVTGGDY